MEVLQEWCLKVCDELCGKTKGRRDRRNTCWWNEPVKEAIDRKKKMFNMWYKNCSPENKNNYRKVRNQTKKMVAKAMKQASEADEGALRQTKRSFQVSEIHEKR